MRKPRRTYKYVQEHEILVIEVSGTNVAGPSSHRFEELVGKLEEYNTHKCLFDYRNGEFEIDVWTAYNRPKVARALQFPADIKIAAVYKEITPDIEFNTTVFQNRGYSVMAFTDYDAAVTWLAS